MRLQVFFNKLLGLYRFFRTKTHFLLSGLIALSVACTGVICLKAGMFPMPDPRHNSWGLLLNFTVITPHLMLIGLLKDRHSSGLRTYLIFSIMLLLLLSLLPSWLGSGTLQRLIHVATLVPVGVIGFSFWRVAAYDVPEFLGGAEAALLLLFIVISFECLIVMKLLMVRDVFFGDLEHFSKQLHLPLTPFKLSFPFRLVCRGCSVD